MRYIVDNDLHIHSHLSFCSGDPEQTTERILKYAEENGLKTICITDHFWDERVEGGFEMYKLQDFNHISLSKPLPQSENVRFLFGCEADLSPSMTLGVSKERIDEFDFIVIPTTHMHLEGYPWSGKEGSHAAIRAKAWVDRLDALLAMDLPFEKVGIAHLTVALIAPTHEEYIEVLNLIPESEMYRLFKKCAELKVGIEINMTDMMFEDEDKEPILRPYKIAKECGCKFYLGSDAHNPSKFLRAKEVFEKAIDMLGLTEDDKCTLCFRG